MVRLFCAAFLAIALSSCSRAEGEPSDPPNGLPAAPGAAASPSAGSEAVRPGTYYLAEDESDAVNLRIEENGTFFWNVCGCDYMFHSHGNWFADGEGILLSALPERPLKWPAGRSFANDVTLPIEVVAGPEEGELTISGEANLPGARPGALPGDETFPFRQRWRSGRICADCGGALGPLGLYECDLPLTMTNACQGLG